MNFLGLQGYVAAWVSITSRIIAFVRVIVIFLRIPREKFLPAPSRTVHGFAGSIWGTGQSGPSRLDCLGFPGKKQ